MLKVYTDGSCYPNPGPEGGWAAVFCTTHGVLFYFGRIRLDGVTNNIAEVWAIKQALTILSPGTKVEVVSDSLWAIQSILGNYKIKANLELIEATRLQLDRVGRDNVTFTHIRGHRGEVHNEMADKLAGQYTAALPQERVWNGLKVEAVAHNFPPTPILGQEVREYLIDQVGGFELELRIG